MWRHPVYFMTRLIQLTIGLFLVAAVTLTAAPSVRANPSILYAAPAAQGSGDCSSWDNVCILQTALGNAISDDEIWVKQGVHKPTTDPSDRAAAFALKNGVALYGGFVGTEISLSQRDWQANLTVLSGDIDNNDSTDPSGVVTDTVNIQGNNTIHVVAGGGTNNTAVLDGFIITAGQANGVYGNGNGGGMNSDSSSPTLMNVTFSGNFAVVGGGMYNSGYEINPTLTNVTFSGNSASVGGGMYNYWGSIPTLTDVTFSGNFASSEGGGMYNNRSGPTLTDVTFSGNSASAGGGMFNSESSPTLTNVIFSGNSASTDGGGMFNVSGSPTLTNVTFSGNIATANGGGMRNHWQSNPRLTNVTFSGNSAANGGGMFNSYSSSPTLINSILWGDTPDEIYNDSSNVTVAYSDVQGCGGSGAGWNSACGTDNGGNIDVNPLFVNAAGGDLHLQITSPAIDAGDNTAVPFGVTTDLDSNPRFVDVPTITDTGNGTPPIVDMGAYELDITPPAVLSITRTDANPTNAASVNFSVAFSEPVTGVDAADFEVMMDGLTEASISGLDPDVGLATTYTVTVSTGSGDGQLWLEVPASATIYDPADNQLNSAFTNGEVYDVDKTAPTVLSITRADPNPTNAANVDFSVAFSEAVAGVDAGDFRLTTTGAISAASLMGVSGSGTLYTVTVSTGTGGGTLRLDVPDTTTITDTVGNTLSGLPYIDGEAYTILYEIFLPIISRNTP